MTNLQRMPLKGIIVPCMDARRNQVYTAIYKSDGETLSKLTEDMAISIDELADRLREYPDEAIYISGDGYEVAHSGLKKKGIMLSLTPKQLVTESAYSCAAVALRKYKHGEFTTDTEFKPTYLRLPQAERERLEKEKA